MEMEAEETPTSAATKTKEEIEAEVPKAMLARLEDFKQQADNLTLEGVRRALEKDLGMERLSLDAHKKFIKQCLEKYFYGTGGAETEREAVEEPVLPNQEKIQIEEDIRDGNSVDLNENSEGSPALGGHENADQETEKNHISSGIHSEISEDMIKKAIRKRAPYFRSNLEITMSKVRRLLEGDLRLEKNSLDAFKKFIFEELDTVLQSEESVKTTNGGKEPKKTSSRGTTGKISKVPKRTRNDLDPSDSEDVLTEDKEDVEIRTPEKRPAQKYKVATKVSKMQKTSMPMSKTSGSEKKKPVEVDSERSDESDGGKSSEDVLSEDEEDAEIRKPKRRPAQKYKVDTKVSKRQKTSVQRSKTSGSEKKKPMEVDSDRSDESDGGKSSEGDHSQSSGEEKEVKKKTEKPAQIYGKQVEHLRSIIKSCGMSVPPTVYKRVKQAPESKREDVLIKELEEILEREGLSTNPSEKEIKAVKKKKERAKDLEGIDMGNIVSSSRRRTSNYIPPPKPKIEADSEEDDDDEENEEDSEEGDNNGEDSSEASDGDDAEEESD